MPQRAYPYSRFSCSKQKDGDSLRRQNDWHRAVCQRNDWVLDDTLQFIDNGVSAKDDRNSDVGDLARFLKLAESGTRITPGSVLLVEVLDRLSREQIDDAYDLFRRILKTGVWICTREPERI
jgi:DNA invertase Pin-like site-specific DNA recombinase